MNRRIVLDARVVEDLREQFNYLSSERRSVAARYLQSVEESFEEIARFPNMGSPKDFNNARLAGLRQWRVHGFENFQIFYRPIDDGIEVLRVLHGSRDLERLLQEDASEENEE